MSLVSYLLLSVDFQGHLVVQCKMISRLPMHLMYMFLFFFFNFFNENASMSTCRVVLM